MSAIPDPVHRPRPPKRQRLDSFKSPQPRSSPAVPQTQQIEKPSAKRCQNPSCKSLDIGEEDGIVICQQCGTVVSEINIVSEMQFAETAAGGHIALGSYVGNDQAHASSGITGLRHGGSSSREMTESNGRRYIHQIGAALVIPPSLTDSGFNVYKLAVANNFIQGRTSRSVAACSLYIACRLREHENSYMLIDFADILQLNVFKLGTLYKKLLEDLRINGTGYLVHPLNPETLIWRFASKIELGSHTTQVANDAVRIVQRMRRDWMTPGRRPAGICGAALIMAARMNNFCRTVREMVYTVKVTEITLMKRLAEFAKTGSGGLTVEEFRRIDLERFEDPPAFQAEKKKKPGRKRKVIELDDDGDTNSESERAMSAAPSNVGNEQLQSPNNTQQQTQASRQSMPPPPTPIDPQLLAHDSQITASGPQPTSSEPPAKKRRGRPPSKSKQPTSKAQAPVTPPVTQPLDDEGLDVLMNPTTSLTQASAASFTQILDSTTNPDNEGEAVGIAPASIRPPIQMTEDISDSEFGPNDPEILNCKLTDEESAIKTLIWTHENREWIRAQHAKELKQRLMEENGTVRQIKKRIRRRTRMGDMRAYRRGQVDENGEALDEEEDSMPAEGAADAVGKMLMKRGYSRKINYEAVNKVYERSASSRGSTSTSRRASVSGAGSPGAGDLGVRSPGAGDLGATSPGAASPPAPSPGAGSPNARAPFSMLASSKSRRGSVTVRVTTPGGTNRLTRPSTPAPTLTPQPPPLSPPTPIAAPEEEEVDENAIANDNIPIPIPDDIADDDDDEGNPDDYYDEVEDEAEDEGDEDIEAMLEAIRRQGEEAGDDG